MIVSMEQHGKVYKVFRILPGKNDGKNKILLGRFKTSEDAERFMNRIG